MPPLADRYDPHFLHRIMVVWVPGFHLSPSCSRQDEELLRYMVLKLGTPESARFSEGSGQVGASVVLRCSTPTKSMTGSILEYLTFVLRAGLHVVMKLS